MPRWADLSGAERVGLYTRQSLYVVLWGYNALVLASAAGRLDGDGETTALVAGGFAVTAVAFPGLVAALRGFPQVPSWRVVGPLAVAGAVYVCVAAVAWGPEARTSAALVAIACLTIVLGLTAGRRTGAALIALGAVLLEVLGDEPSDAVVGALVAAALLFTARASMWVFGVVTELDGARQAQAQLSVAEERLRFSRDVHDVLGRRLSAIAVQAELAATLAARGDERAAADRMLEVRGVAHEALREARELARGYRSTDFAQEVEGARSLLRSAGIDVRLSVDDMPRAWHEAAAWVVRESVTNVLRHSRAANVEIAYADGRLRVDNDGARPDGSADGAGLRGLRERLAPLGATLAAGAHGADRWVVLADLPGTGPLSAR
jgi:two-component system sensor histidine kinase DesK